MIGSVDEDLQKGIVEVCNGQIRCFQSLAAGLRLETEQPPPILSHIIRDPWIFKVPRIKPSVDEGLTHGLGYP